MRSIVLSNGQLCVALDESALVRDIYYPYVGYEDHVRGHYIHRVGVWVDGNIHWLGEDTEWQITVKCETDALASDIHAVHSGIGVELVFKDIVYNEKPVFIRRVSVKNTGDTNREIKVFFGHQFEIYKAHGSDTAFFDPLSHSVIHYKGHRVFLIGGTIDGSPFSDYVTGRANFQGKEGSHRDADDGELSKNAIEHGPADSVIGLYGSYAPGQSRMIYYWLLAAESIDDVRALNDYVEKKTPEHLVKTATNYWHAWISSREHNLKGLSPAQAVLFKQSLLHARAHVDNHGGVLASADSDMLQYGLDTYCYVWPRDAAFAALSFAEFGDTGLVKNFLDFSKDVMSKDGYFLHKFLPDKSFGSSWHPWIYGGESQLPIQEDETAIVVYLMQQYYERSRDLDYLEVMYNPLVEKAADFLVAYRDPETGLPLPSYDLWERKRGTSTYTSSLVYASLISAAELSRVLGKDTHEERYRKAAEEVKEGILKYLYDEKTGMFLNMLDRKGKEWNYDKTIDISSAYGLFRFGVLPADDKKLAHVFETSVRELSHGITAGGIARFEHDDYYQIDGETNGNPWVITTLWYAEYLLANASSEHDLDRVRDIFNWVVLHAQPSGVLSEQLHPKTGEQVGATPLTWAHAAYVSAIIRYLDRLREIAR